MISPDYSRDAPLLVEEEIDFDTVHGNETGINDTRMRLPERYDIAKYYQRFKKNPERGRWVKKKADKKLDFSSDFDWQITYSFPDTLRDPRTSNGHIYGGLNVTYRRLYLILCEHFNSGNYFVDDYFDSVYPYTMKETVDASLNNIKSKLLDMADSAFYQAEYENAMEGIGTVKLTASGELDRRATVRNRNLQLALDNYYEEAKIWEEAEGIHLAELIKDDIINSLMSGIIPLNHTNAESTRKNRALAGLSEEPEFFAIGRLIEHIQLYVNIGGNKQWQTQAGIRV